jgi:prepilin-type N-terminal cleavage/methylation domain-containing protein
MIASIRNHKPTRQRGFSLLEVLLVMALLSAVLVAGINLHWQRSLQHKIDKASLQIQQWLQAGLAYYADKGHWPTTQSTDFGDYLPVGSHLNPWGNPYQITQNKDAHLFTVTTQVPFFHGDEFSSARNAIAQRVSDELPNATVVQLLGGPPEVKAQVTQPGESAKSAIQVISISNVNSTNIIKKPTAAQCPPATKHPEIYYALTSFTPPNGNFNASKKRYDHLYYLTDVKGTATEQADDWKMLATSSSFRHASPGGHIQSQRGRLMAIVTCEPGPANSLTNAPVSHSPQPEFLF